MPYRKSVSSSSSELEGAPSPEQETLSISTGIGKRLTTGGSYRIQHNFNRFESNSVFSLLNPAYSSDWTLSFSQPLAKGRGRTLNTAEIMLAENGTHISRISLYQEAMDLLLEVEKSYLDMIYWRKELEVRNYSLKLAEELLSRSQERVAVGKATSLEVFEAKVEVAAREEAFIISSNQVREAQDRLRQVMGIVGIVEFSGIDIVPIDTLGFNPFKPRLEESVARAFAERTDYQKLKLELENNRIALVMSQNKLWPTVDLQATLAVNGLGTNYGDSWDDIKSGDFYTWQVGVSVSVPWGNREARSYHRQQQLEKERLISSLKELEQMITVEIRSAVRSVETDQKRIEVTREARQLAEQKLLLEEERFEQGLSTSHRLLECQEDLIRIRANELKALVDYQKSCAGLNWAEGVILKKLGIDYNQLCEGF